MQQHTTAPPPDPLLDFVRERERHLGKIAKRAMRLGINPFSTAEQVYAATRARRAVPTVGHARPRPRGAGRPARHAGTRSNARAGDSGDDGPGEPAPAWLPVVVVSGDTAPGDAAVARSFERFLASRRPDATWSVAS